MRTLISDQRCSAYSSDEEKLRVYIRIVRLLLEEEDSVQAETYYNRATSLIHSTGDRETLLTYKLCQARISDYARKFLEAASRYHELSFVGEIDEDERRYMLYVNAFYYLVHLTDNTGTRQICCSNMCRPCTSWSKPLSDSVFSLSRRAYCRVTHLQHSLKNVP